MKQIISFILLITCFSCSDLSKKFQTETKNPAQATQQAKVKKVSTSKKVHEVRKSVENNPEAQSKDITGTLISGIEYEATPDVEGYVVSFDPFIARDDSVFFSATSQVVSKLYNDQIKDDSHISIRTDIDYAIFTGLKARYKIVPYKETNGEISSVTITTI